MQRSIVRVGPLVSSASARIGLAAVVVLVAATAATAAEGDARRFVVFGPQAYQRGPEGPETVVHAFSVLDPRVPYVLRVTNPARGGSAIVSSGVVQLNGREVVGTHEIGPLARVIEKPITLERVNQVAVQLRGGMGETLAIEVLGLDGGPPEISATVGPEANPNGWHNTEVTVSFTCVDATSGIASCPGPVTVSGDGAGQVVTGTAVDRAGNAARIAVNLNVDKTPPTARPAVTPPPNANGWHNADATVGWVCEDTTSGVVACPPPTIVSTEGAGRRLMVRVVDRAGNTGLGAARVNLDKTPPTMQVTWPPVAVFSTDRPSIEIAGHVTDGLSGVEAAVVQGAPGEVGLAVPDFALVRALQTATAPGQASRVNPFQIEARDLAGNLTQAALTVNHTLDSHMLPIDPGRVEDRAGVVSSVDRALVGFEEAVTRDRIEEIAAEEGGRVAGYLTGLNLAMIVFDTRHVVDLEAVLARIGARSEVTTALPAFFSKAHVFDNELLTAAQRVAYDSVRLQAAADLVAGGGLPLTRTGIVVIDSGLGRNYGLANELAGVEFIDLCARSGRASRPEHGSAVTGIITGANNAQGNNGVVSGLVGSDFPVTVYGTGCAAPPFLDGALVALALDETIRGVRGPVRVVNLSFGSHPTDAETEAAQESYYEHIFGSPRGVDILWVASAGNDNRVMTCAPGGFPVFPATMACRRPNVVSVGGYDPGTNLRLPDSNHGPAVTLFAPGIAFTATAPGAYGWFAGTSAAAPFVTGAAALLHATHPQSPSSLRQLLADTARPLADPALGQGGLDVEALIAAAQPAPWPPLRRDTFSGTSPSGPQIQNAQPPVPPGLAGFILDFVSVPDLAIESVAAGFRNFGNPPGLLMNEDFSDGNDGESYNWTVYRQELPPGTTFHQVSGSATTGINRLLNHPAGTQGVPVLVGFRFDTTGANVNVEKIRVELFSALGGFHVGVTFPDTRGASFNYRYVVTYALVPLDRVRAVGVIEGSDAGGSDSAVLNAEQPVLQGFELKFRNGPNPLGRLRVRVRPSQALISFYDRHLNDPYDWRIRWVDVQ